MMDVDVLAVEREVFGRALRTLNATGIQYVIAGAFCMHYYTGIWRFTKDMDIFVLPESVDAVLQRLAAENYLTWIEADHWLGKATKQSCVIDVIFGSGNWLAPIDRIWIDRARSARLFGEPVLMSPIEEMIWAKCYIAGRERYDGADVCHLLAASGGDLDWPHLLHRFGEHWELLLANLILFGFVYPTRQGYVPEWLLRELFDREFEQRRRQGRREKVCRGTLLDRFSYDFDVEHLGYRDAREAHAKAHGSKHEDVVRERAWAREKIARGEVYKKEA